MKLRYNSGALEDSSRRVLAAVDGCTFRCGMNSEQQEAFGQQLAKRWNAHDELVAALELIVGVKGADAERIMREYASAAVTKATAQ